LLADLLALARSGVRDRALALWPRDGALDSTGGSPSQHFASAPSGFRPLHPNPRRRSVTETWNDERVARQLAADHGIAFETALRIAQEASRAARAAEAGQAVLPSWAAPPAETGPTDGTAPRLPDPHPNTIPEGDQR
jgi:hypothetical protein